MISVIDRVAAFRDRELLQTRKLLSHDFRDRELLQTKKLLSHDFVIESCYRQGSY